MSQVWIVVASLPSSLPPSAEARMARACSFGAGTPRHLVGRSTRPAERKRIRAASDNRLCVPGGRLVGGLCLSPTCVQCEYVFSSSKCVGGSVQPCWALAAAARAPMSCTRTRELAAAHAQGRYDRGRKVQHRLRKVRFSFKLALPLLCGCCWVPARLLLLLLLRGCCCATDCDMTITTTVTTRD